MALVTHRSGDQLSATRMKAKANFTDIVATLSEVTAGDIKTVGSGMGLEQFRGVCMENFASITEAVAVNAQGTLTVDTQVTADNTMTIGSTVYTFKAGATAVEGEIGIGANVAACLVAIVAAINGTDGFNSPHPLVTIGTFASDDAIITARTNGVVGNSITSTETFTAATNIFDATSLGTTTLGAEGPVFTEINDGDMFQGIRTKRNANFIVAAAA